MSGTTSSATNLADMASGNYLKNGNPYFNQALQGQLDNTAAQVQSQFSGSGRYGSAANTNALTTQLGNIRSNALYNQYNQDTQNMLAANNAIDSANSTNYQNQLAGNQAVISAGQLQDAAKQADLDAAQRKWTAEDNQGWTRLGLLQSAAAGSSGNYGSNVATTTQSPNLLSTIGGIGSTAAKSDVRLKENIVPIGEKNGLPIYEWNYIGRSERYRGVMAQDVQKVRPDAVVMEGDGYLGVYYDKIGISMERVN
ncbi:tail fiber domain-containing protein [Rhizobium sp. CNPSo 4062]|uniref:tail fiber domain-containing protein n=1 Tax=Rhizobium sp. CNPSo 4062 TaxID=3021410 RepID=UPI00254D31B2|nr:tail fiber domain-containing protein [Rhizobium sp. CNPSo 4062]MDK4703900.1 tail fiber domain-containing protein [Rhizobium sp. CNPSo 4062]